ncbi:MAG: PD-(D/E)XK motif protein [Chitinophagaceae bacterium]
MTKINEIWIELDRDKSVSKGLLLRRYSAASLPDIFIAVQRPENYRCIAIRIRSGSKIDILGYANLKDIRVSIIPDDGDNSRSFLIISLLNDDHLEVFASLAEDLLNQISGTSQEERLLKEVLNRFEKWKELFDKAAQEGLTSEEQKGLYGELIFLRKWLSRSDNTHRCLESWLGPEKELRDFQSEGWAVEVKTTSANNHQKIHISSERQLDITNLDTLILYHISVESQRYNGETLNQIVDSLLKMLSENISAQIRFKSKLIQGGYFFHHSPKYEFTGYQIRQEIFYKVHGNFPRIQESDVRKGVGDVKYSIILSDHKEYILTEQFVLQMIN